jgi:Fe-S-cluster containining protein
VKQFSFRIDQLKRAPKSRRILRKIFSKADCIKCGACCKSPQKKHKTNVLGIDPFRSRIRQIARFNGLNISEAPFEGFDVLGEDKCSFLDESDGKNACSIYNFRPLICLTFPFMVQRMESLHLENGETGTQDLVMLTTACPPLKEAKDNGVNFICFDEVVRGAVIDGREALTTVLPILGDTFLNLIQSAMWGTIFDFDKILEINGRGIFPIG